MMLASRHCAFMNALMDPTHLKPLHLGQQLKLKAPAIMKGY
jgi:hypothetical protein